MNIFALHQDPRKAAQALCNRHVSKMLLETAQILSTLLEGPYKPTHINHPCVQWAGATEGNLDWTISHGMELCKEFHRRFGKNHKSSVVIIELHNKFWEDLADEPEYGINWIQQPFVQCMPDEFKGPDPVQAYRRYYAHKQQEWADKGRSMTWQPTWIRPAKKG